MIRTGAGAEQIGFGRGRVVALRGAMEPVQAPAAPTPAEHRLALALFVACAALFAWGVSVGWESRNLPGVEFRQAQTALSAHFIKQERNFSPAYPTPVLGKPWSVPMEFPLYQWTVAVLGNATGLGVVKAGRLVSIACFVLMLPALYLLLGRWRVAPARRWPVLALVVSCPLHIFYARAVLIETMALMFALWFWVALERAVEGRSRGWLALAVAAGTGAGLVKVTTFLLYLLPAGVWAARRLWAGRRGAWRRDAAWMTAAVAVPFAAALAWLQFADATKAQNPMADFLTSTRLQDFNLGTNETRFSGEFWAMKGRIVRDQLTWLPVLVAGAALALAAGRARAREILACLGVFAAALAVFPVLYAYHDYYYVANTVMLEVALGLVLVALAEGSCPRWLVAVAGLVLAGGQAWRYLDWYYPPQSRISPGGDGLSWSLRDLTRPDEVIVVTGQDWNSMTPFYSQRRALMLRFNEERVPARVDVALAQLAGEKIGALVLTGPVAGREWLVDRLAARGLSRQPLYLWRDAAVYLREERREEALLRLEDKAYHEVALAPGVELPLVPAAGKWMRLEELRPGQRRMFEGIVPRPARFFSTYGPVLDRTAGRMDFGVHPVTRLVWPLAAGKHVLRTTVRLPPDAYAAALPRADVTDGIEIVLSAPGPGEGRTVLATRRVDPRDEPADRGAVPVMFSFELREAAEVELYFGPGPGGRDTRDWAVISRLRID